jgi:hypothetical protein
MSAGKIRKPFAAVAIVGAFAVSVPVAQAAPPDAVDRAVSNQQAQQHSFPPDAVERAVGNHHAEHSFVGSPDAIDRALAVREAERIAAIDARERGLTERPAHSTTYSPDAFERALITSTDAMNAQTVSMLEARERGLSGRPGVSSPALVASGDGFDWSGFGMGAGAAMGLFLVAGLGTLAIRRSGRMSTA